MTANIFIENLWLTKKQQQQQQQQKQTNKQKTLEGGHEHC